MSMIYIRTSCKRIPKMTKLRWTLMGQGGGRLWSLDLIGSQFCLSSICKDAAETWPMLFIFYSYEKSISRKHLVLPTKKFLSFVLSRNTMMLLTTYYLSVRSLPKSLEPRPSNSEVNMRFSLKDRTFEVKKFFIIWHFCRPVIGPRACITNYLITESEFFTGKSQTEALPY